MTSDGPDFCTPEVPSAVGSTLENVEEWNPAEAGLAPTPAKRSHNKDNKAGAKEAKKDADEDDAGAKENKDQDAAGLKLIYLSFCLVTCSYVLLFNSWVNKVD